MRRRQFVTALGLAVAWPFVVRAQPSGRIYRIGMVDVVSEDLNAANLAAFRRGLHELGYEEGRNLVLDYRSADGDATRFPTLISEMIASNVDLIVVRGTPAALAAKRTTNTIPIVIAGSGDPLLIVASLAKPGGNITGLSGVQPDLEPKRMDLLREVAPATSGIAALLNMSNPVTAPQLKELERAAQARGLRFRLLDVRGPADIERAFGTLDSGSEAVVVGLEAVTQAHRHLIAELAARHRVAAVYGGREFVEAGGLMSYAPSFTAMYHRAATYVDKILRGAKPADLPVEQPATFELVINLRAVRGLGLTLPPSVLARADEVIE